MTAPVPATVVLARAIQRRLLFLVAPAVRSGYRDEMIATFEAASAEAGRRGTLAVVALLVREVADLSTAGRGNRPAVLAYPRPAGRQRTWIDLTTWRQAWRSLRRRPAFLAAAVLTLGSGAGITTAVFSLVDTVLLKPLPYPDPNALVTVYESTPGARERRSLVAPGRIEDWQQRTQAFVTVSGSYAENVTDTSGAEPERLDGRRVAPRYFTVYGMAPLAGRTFIDAEEHAKGPGAAVISEQLWTRRFQRDRAAIGRALRIGGRSYAIVGVMPAEFTAAAAAADVWLPAQVDPFVLRLRDARFFGGVGRLRHGVAVEAGERDLAAVQEGLAREFPKTDAGWSVEVRSLKEERIGRSRRGLVLVFGAVLALWVIAIANIAGLTLVQVRRRSAELAIRAAIGASRASVVGTMVREGVVIAAAGGLAAAALAWWLISLMPTVLATMPRITEVTLDWRALAFAAGTSMLAAFAFSLVPAVTGTRLELNRVLSGRRAAAGGRHRLQQALVVWQVAASVLLVGAAMLLVRSYYNLTHVQAGFDASNTIRFHMGARWDEDRTRIGQLQLRLLEELERLPHVQSAGMVNFLPATGASLRSQFKLDGIAGSNPDGSITTGTRMVSSGYLRTIRVPLVGGSWCPPTTTDIRAPRTALVNQRFVEENAAGQNLVGRTLRWTQGDAVPTTIVGIVGNILEDSFGTGPVPYLYTCSFAGAWPDPEYVVRTSDPTAFAADLRRIVRELDPGRALFGLRSVQSVLDMTLDQPRTDATMLSLFSGAAVALAAIGLYSLFMLVVSERSREMAVRLAIGAPPRELVRLIMMGAGRLLAGGIVLGVLLTAAADRLLRGVLFGVSPLDATALAAAALTLAFVSAIAVAGPALRAARIAPIEALRGE